MSTSGRDLARVPPGLRLGYALAFTLALTAHPAHATSLLGSVRWATNSPSGVYRYDPVSFAVEGLVSGAEYGSEPGFFALLPDGDVLFSNPSFRNVLRYDGASLAFEGVFVAAGPELASPTRISLGTGLDLYVQDGTEILRYDGSTGSFVGTVVGGLSVSDTFRIGPDGAIWVMQQGSSFGNTHGGVARYDADSGALLSVFTTFDPTFYPGTAMAFSPDGSALFALGWGGPYGDGHIARYAVSTGDRTGLAQVGIPFFDSRDLVFGPDGLLYATGDSPCGRSFVSIDPTTLVESCVGSGNEYHYTVGMAFVPDVVPEPTLTLLLMLGLSASAIVSSRPRRARSRGSRRRP
jgi:hypothetical protein